MRVFTEQRTLTNGVVQFDSGEVLRGIEKARPTRALLESLAMPNLAELPALLHGLVVEQERKADVFWPSGVLVFCAWRRVLWLADWAVAAPLQGHSVRSASASPGASATGERTVWRAP